MTTKGHFWSKLFTCLIKRTTKGQRPRPREPRVWSTSQQSPPSLWSALNKVNIIIFITATFIVITTRFITITTIFTHIFKFKYSGNVFACNRKAKSSSERIVGCYKLVPYLELFRFYISKQDPVGTNKFFIYLESFVWIRVAYKIKLRAHFGPVYALQRNPCFPKVMINMSGL